MNTRKNAPTDRSPRAERMMATARKAAAVCGLGVLVVQLTGFQGCGQVKQTRKLEPAPLLEATLEELVAKLNEQHDAVTSINAEAELVATTGSAYSGVIEEYHDVKTFVLAQREYRGTDDPRQAEAEKIRMIGQAPIVRKTVFDMTADARVFRIHLPTKNKFIVGPAKLERRSEKPIENLRPQHLLEALFIAAPWTDTPVLLEENEFEGKRYYGVSEVVLGDKGEMALHRKWWFDRSDLSLARAQRFARDGELISDIRYTEWRQVDGQRFPRRIDLTRPRDDYRLALEFKKVALNQRLEPKQFLLEKPEGAELVEVKETTESPTP